MGINCEQCLPLYYHHSVSKSCLRELCYILHECIRVTANYIACQCNEDGIIDDGQCDNMVSNVVDSSSCTVSCCNVYVYNCYFCTHKLITLQCFFVIKSIVPCFVSVLTWVCK